MIFMAMNSMGTRMEHGVEAEQRGRRPDDRARPQPERHLETVQARLRHRGARRDEERWPGRHDGEKLDKTDRHERQEIRGRQLQS